MTLASALFFLISLILASLSLPYLSTQLLSHPIPRIRSLDGVTTTSTSPFQTAYAAAAVAVGFLAAALVLELLRAAFLFLHPDQMLKHVRTFKRVVIGAGSLGSLFLAGVLGAWLEAFVIGEVQLSGERAWSVRPRSHAADT